MPRPAKGARLHKFKHRPHWYIRDTGEPDRSTGCERRADAEKALAAYIANKGRASAANEPENLTCGEALAIYAEEHAINAASPERIGYAIDALLPFWAALKVSHVKGETCRRYGKTRKAVTKKDENGEPIEWRPISPGTIRRELGTLQAALNYCHKEGLLTSAPIVSLPEKPEPKQRWLTRDEAAKLIWTAYRGHKTSHIAKFIIIGIYTGTRKDAILRMGFKPNTLGGWFDLENERMFRISEGERRTKKRRTPAPIPKQLLSHLKRWEKNGQQWAVEYQNGPIADIKKGFSNIAKEADLFDVTPHTLKHTAITWALQNGMKTWDAAGYFSTSPETIEKVYGHHATDFLQDAKKAMETRRRK